MDNPMNEEEVLYHQSDNIVTCIICRKNGTPLQFIKKNFIGFNQAVITDLEYSNLVKMRPTDAKGYFIQLWCKYNRNYFNFPPAYGYEHLFLWNIASIGNKVTAHTIIIDLNRQEVYPRFINNLIIYVGIEITEEEYFNILDMKYVNETLGFIEAVSLFTKYTGKTIDEINFCSI